MGSLKSFESWLGFTPAGRQLLPPSVFSEQGIAGFGALPWSQDSCVREEPAAQPVSFPARPWPRSCLSETRTARLWMASGTGTTWSEWRSS